MNAASGARLDAPSKSWRGSMFVQGRGQMRRVLLQRKKDWLRPKPERPNMEEALSSARGPERTKLSGDGLLITRNVGGEGGVVVDVRAQGYRHGYDYGVLTWRGVSGVTMALYRSYAMTAKLRKQAFSIFTSQHNSSALCTHIPIDEMSVVTVYHLKGQRNFSKKSLQTAPDQTGGLTARDGNLCWHYYNY